MPEDLFLRASEEVKNKYLSFPGLQREYQALLGGDMEYVVLDFETTGFDPERDRIIEVGAVLAAGQEPIERLTSLIDPGSPIPPQITLLTGIDDEAVAGSPSIDDFFGDLAEFLGERPVVAYSRFEEQFLSPLYSRLGYGRFVNPYIDAHEIATLLMPSLTSHRQTDLARMWEIDVGRAHRALDDAETLFHLYNILLNGLYDVPLVLLRALVDHAPAHAGGLTMLLRRLLEERSGGRKPGALRLADVVLKDSSWAEIAPLEGTDSPGGVHADEVKAVFAPEGPIASQFRDYEERDEQVDMAEATRKAFVEGEILLVEAGTGTGKSLAYLVPGVLWSKATEYPLVVSTRTLNLQDQLSTKDLPTLEAALGAGSFRYAVLKGYNNYLCLRKMQSLLAGRRKLGERQLSAFGMLLNWVTESDAGDVSLLNVPHLTGLDEMVMANHRECPGGRCGFTRQGCCFYRRALYKAKRSHIVVVNHSLLLAGVNLAFRSAVVDEAHTLEDVATEQYTVELDYREARRFLASLFDPLDGSGFIPDLADAAKKHLPEDAVAAARYEIEEASEATEVALEGLERLFLGLCEFGASEYAFRDTRFTEGEMRSLEFESLRLQAERFSESLDTMRARLLRLKALFEERGDDSSELAYQMGDLDGKAARVDDHMAAVEVFFSPKDDGRVRWATVTGVENFEAQSLRASPVDVGPELAEALFDEDVLSSVVLTSATLTVNGSFDFFRSRTGLDLQGVRPPVEHVLDSSFDYSRQMQILILHDMPDPSSGDYENQIADVLGDVIVAAGGGVLALFTNRRLMTDTYERLSGEMQRQGLNVLCQLPGYSRRRLAEEFIADRSASLLGTSSFWEGVDARGDTLRLVVVTRIPFESPGKPVFIARSEQVRLEGGSDFMDFGLPLAALRLKQGVGRLIRTRQDKGQVLLMDSRINTRRYGQVLLRSLPKGRRRNVSLDDLGRAISDFQKR